MTFTTRSLVAAIATLSSIGYANAAGLDRSTQPSWGFTQDGTFAYIEHVTINPTVKGKDNALVATPEASFKPGRDVPDMTTDYSFLNFGAKADLNDTITLGAFFDQPWGADVQFDGNNNFTGGAVNTANGLIQKAGIANVNDLASASTFINTSTQQLAAAQLQLQQASAQIAAGQTQLNQAKAALAANPALAPVLQPQITAGEQRLAAATQQLQQGQAQFDTKQAQLAQFKNLTAVANNVATDKGGTNVHVKSQNFTGLMGVKLGDKKQFQVYGGPSLQRLEGDVHLRGDAYGPAAGYDAGIAQSTGVGWMAGVAYSKPEIALKAALTYRSEIDHDADIYETLPLAPLVGLAPVQKNETTITTPQSVNVDFQTGLNPTTLLTAKLRWVPWSDFAIKPKLYGDLSKLNLVSYDKDGWTAELGLGKKINDKLAVTGALGWDSGSGNPTTSLGPIDGNWNVGLGARYNLTPEWALSGGAKYLMFGDAKAKLPNGNVVGDFTDNDGMVYGVRLSYQKK